MSSSPEVFTLAPANKNPRKQSHNGTFSINPANPLSTAVTTLSPLLIIYRPSTNNPHFDIESGVSVLKRVHLNNLIRAGVVLDVDFENFKKKRRKKKRSDHVRINMVDDGDERWMLEHVETGWKIPTWVAIVAIFMIFGMLLMTFKYFPASH